MRVALAQMTVVEGDIDRNHGVAREAVAEAIRAGAEVVAFPELFLTGYDWGQIRNASPASTRMVERHIRALAGKITVIGGSFAEARRGGICNTTIVVKPGGRRAATYRKMHLFSMLGEDRVFTGGDSTVSFPLGRWRAGLATCYDLRFPEMFRRLTYAHRCNVVFVQSSWPMPRQSAWDVLLRARAMEDQLYVCGTNRVGPGGKLVYFGSTQVVSPLGEVLCNKGRTEGLLVADLDLDEVSRVRRLIPALKERQPRVYGKY
ncbi:MAG: nitrilase-related carbon-nitrogen hydrolase [Acidobacteriota bacterium]